MVIQNLKEFTSKTSNFMLKCLWLTTNNNLKQKTVYNKNQKFYFLTEIVNK